MNVMSALLAKRAFFDVLEGAKSKHFSIPLLTYLKPAFFCVNNPLSFWLITYTALQALRVGTSIFCTVV